jgi:hypothetical protein
MKTSNGLHAMISPLLGEIRHPVGVGDHYLLGLRNLDKTTQIQFGLASSAFCDGLISQK